MPSVGYSRAQAVVAGSALAFGAWVFVTHGGRWITAAGIYSLASSAFVGYAGLWWLERLGPSLPSHLFVATLIGYLSNVLTFAFAWAQSDKNFPKHRCNVVHSDWGRGLPRWGPSSLPPRQQPMR